jgi:hypothetical protein
MDVFNNDSPTPNTVTVDALVGDTQKYKTADDLAKAYVNAESFIETLKREKAEEAQKAANAAAKLEVYERLAATKNNDPTPPRQDPPQEQPKVSAEPKVDNLEEKIRSTLEAERDRERKTANRNQVNTKLVEIYGDKAREVVAAKAAELGVGIDWLTSMAETSPAAFFNTIGVEKSKMGTPALKSDVNPASLGETGKILPNTYAYFNEIRRTNPKSYYSAETQRQIFAAAKSNPNFYKE